MNKQDWIKELVSLVKTFLVSFIIVYVISNFIAKPVRVDGSSMYPTLKDKELGFSLILNSKQLERFDIVVIKIPVGSKSKLIVKRIIGLPNETVEIMNNDIYINGEKVNQEFLDLDYVLSQSSNGVFTRDIEAIKLGDDEIYVLGDNRVNSQDSRYYGPFKTDAVVSKGVFVFYPFNEMGIK